MFSRRLTMLRLFEIHIVYITYIFIYLYIYVYIYIYMVSFIDSSISLLHFDFCLFIWLFQLGRQLVGHSFICSTSLRLHAYIQGRVEAPKKTFSWNQLHSEPKERNTNNNKKRRVDTCLRSREVPHPAWKKNIKLKLIYLTKPNLI